MAKEIKGDLYEVDIATGQRRLILRSQNDFHTYFVDRQLRPILAERILPGGGRELCTFRKDD